MTSGSIFANEYRWTPVGYFFTQLNYEFVYFFNCSTSSLCDISDVAGTFLQKLYGSTFQASVICTRQHTRTHTTPVSVQVCVQMITSTKYGINNIKFIVYSLN